MIKFALWTATTYTILLIAVFEYSAYFYKEVNTKNSSIKELLINNNIRFSNVVLAQTIHETGYYTSKVFKENNNPFGMKHNGRGYSLGTKNGHAYYKTIEDAVKDYAEWQLRYCPKSINTTEEYLQWLEKWGYAEDPHYIEKLRHHLKKQI